MVRNEARPEPDSSGAGTPLPTVDTATMSDPDPSDLPAALAASWATTASSTGMPPNSATARTPPRCVIPAAVQPATAAEVAALPPFVADVFPRVDIARSRPGPGVWRLQAEQTQPGPGVWRGAAKPGG